MLALLFMGYVSVWGVITKRRETGQSARKIGHMKDVFQLIPVVLLIAGVMSSIYTGIATATEAAVLGVIGALALSALQGSLNRETFVCVAAGRDAHERDDRIHSGRFDISVVDNGIHGTASYSG